MCLVVKSFMFIIIFVVLSLRLTISSFCSFSFFFFKQKTAYEMRISDWSSDVCSSDLTAAEVIETIKRIADELFFNSGGIDPSLIVVDTVARALAGADENSASDVGRLVDAFDWLKSQWGCAVLPIHHTGHSQEAKTRGRGSSALYAGLDGEFLVSSDGDTVQLRSMKEKDWPEPMALCLRSEEQTSELQSLM